MAAPFHNLLSKTDRALVAYIISEAAGTTANTFPAKRSLDKNLPCIICFTEKAVLETEYPAAYRATSTVVVKTHAALEPGDGDESARLTSESLHASVFDCFKRYITADADDSALANAITAAARALAIADPTNHSDLADFTCLRVFDKGISLNTDEEGTFWADNLNLELIVVPANVS